MSIQLLHLLPLHVLEAIGIQVLDKLYLQLTGSAVHIGVALIYLHVHHHEHAADIVAVLVAHILVPRRKRFRPDIIVKVCVPRHNKDTRLPPAPLDSVAPSILSVLVPNVGEYLYCIKDTRLTPIGKPLNT